MILPLQVLAAPYISSTIPLTTPGNNYCKARLKPMVDATYFTGTGTSNSNKWQYIPAYPATVVGSTKRCDIDPAKFSIGLLSNGKVFTIQVTRADFAGDNIARSWDSWSPEIALGKIPGMNGGFFTFVGATLNQCYSVVNNSGYSYPTNAAYSCTH